MVWKVLGRLAGKLTGVVNDAATSAANTGSSALDAVKSGAVKVVNLGAAAITGAGDYALEQIDGTYASIKVQVGAAIQVADDVQINLRDHIAENLRAGGQVAAAGAGVAAEFSLLGATGILFYPIVAGAGMDISQAFIGGAADKLSRIVRGDRIRFFDIYVQEAEIIASILGEEADVMAIMYMPKNKDADNAGFALITEGALFGLEHSYAVGTYEEQEFFKARMAVVTKKREMGIEPQSRALRAEHIASRQP